MRHTTQDPGPADNFRIGRLLQSGLLGATLALFAACGSDAPTDTRPTDVPGPQFGVTEPANGTGQCMGDDAADYGHVDGVKQDSVYSDELNCTANDISVASTVVSEFWDGDSWVTYNPESPPHCIEGDDVRFKMTANLAQNAASERQDIGVWIASDGGDAETGDCYHYNLIGGDGTINLDGDQCHGMEKGASTGLEMGEITVECKPDPETSLLSVPGCISWKVPADDQVCPDNADGTEPGSESTDFRAGTLPSNKSKCNCEPFIVGIIVDKLATIKVDKVCVGASSGSFDLEIDNSGDPDYDLEADANCGGTTGVDTVGAGNSQTPGANHTVSESGFTAADWVSTLACTKNGAAYIPSESYVAGTDRTVHVDPNDAVVCTFTNVRKSSLKIVKDVVPNGAQDFGFTTTGNGLSGFSLDDDADATLSNEQLFSNLLPDSARSVTETTVAGWTLTNIACTGATSSTVAIVGADANAGFQAGDNKVNVTLAPGENVVCTFTNTRQGSIKIVKNSVPDHAQDFAFTASGTGMTPTSFSLDDDANAALSNERTFSGLLPNGARTVTESAVEGWTLTNIACTGASGSTVNIGSDGDFDAGDNSVSITLAVGEDIVCTFTNTQGGSIKIVKNAVPNHAQDFGYTASGTGMTPATFSLDDDAEATLSSERTFSGLLPNGARTVTETAVEGWTLTNIACTGASGSTVNIGSDGDFDAGDNSVSITLAAGENIVCTFTNTRQGSIKIVKDAVPNGAQDFAYTTSGTGLSGFTLDDDADATYSNQQLFSGLLPNGARTITESAVTGWALTNIVCTGASSSTVLIGSDADFDAGDAAISVTLAAGEDVTCTFTNTQEATLTIAKACLSEGGGAATASETFTFNPTGPGGGVMDAMALACGSSSAVVSSTTSFGTYTIVEPDQPGWQLTNIECVDAGANSSGSVATRTATVSLDPGDNVTCTFTNTLPAVVLGRMTGGGEQIIVGGIRITRGFTIHCDIILSNNLEINWQGNKWHLDKPLTNAYCVDDPDIGPEPPTAGFDTFVGEGIGYYNGVYGYTIEFTFIDAGEPGGGEDQARILIKAPNGTVVLDVPLQELTKGNLQAHEDQPHK